jgi:hypothetical protein
MTVLGVVVVLVLLALLYWGVNTAPFIVGQFRTILSWFLVAVAVVILVLFVLQILGVSTNLGHVRLSFFSGGWYRSLG